MEDSTVSLKQLAATSKHIARRLMIIGENRIELLIVEMQEERERLLHAFLLALGVASLGLLTGITFTAAIAVLLWSYSPAGVLLVLTVLYAGAGTCLYRELMVRLRDWQSFAATLDQLRKDRVGMEGMLA